MVTDKERREIAEKIRKMVEDRYSFTALNVADAIGVEEVIFDDRYALDEACWLRLADLIEPEPELICKWREDENGLYHTSCGSTYETIADTREENGIMFCPYCGREVVDYGYR